MTGHDEPGITFELFDYPAGDEDPLDRALRASIVAVTLPTTWENWAVAMLVADRGGRREVALAAGDNKDPSRLLAALGARQLTTSDATPQAVALLTAATGAAVAEGTDSPPPPDALTDYVVIVVAGRDGREGMVALHTATTSAGDLVVDTARRPMALSELVGPAAAWLDVIRAVLPPPAGP